jgi:uncharacterized protein (TIGR02391 family)
MVLISDVFPPYSLDVLQLPREELAGYLLRYLWRFEMDSGKPFTKANLIQKEHLTDYVPDEVGLGGLIEMSRRLAEAWSWLESQVYIAEDPNFGMGGSGAGFFITDAGRDFAQRPPGETFFHAETLLPVGSLHPVLEKEARPEFIRGAFDKAIFGAMRAVEIHVREQSKLGPEIIGIDLMRKAFEPNAGPLTDEDLPLGERKAVGHLFAGAIGAFRNPTGHRQVNIADPVEAANIIRLADALLRIVFRASSS